MPIVVVAAGAVTDLVIADGTVVTPDGTVAADVAVADGRIERDRSRPEG